MTDTFFEIVTIPLSITLFIGAVRRWENKLTTFQYARITLFCTVPMLLIYLTQQRWPLVVLCAVAVFAAAWLYLGTRPHPLWWNGQHERIDNTQEN